ncbi:MAG: efflux RND transporter permease subunit [Leucobacter sp.]
MYLFTAFSLKNRALIALVTVVAAVFGLIGVGSLKQELMPSVQFPAIAVITNYPGASPEVVNKDVSGPIETAVRGVPSLESTTATSSTGASMVVAQFTYGVDITATEQKVERAIGRISQMLPETADTQVLSGSIDDFPVIQIAVTPADGETPEQTAKTVERIAIPELSDLDGVRDAQLSGAREDRITITPNTETLASNGLTPQAITDALQQSGVLFAAGTVTDGDQTLAVQAGSQLTSVKAIRELPIPRDAAALAAQQQQAEPLPGELVEPTPEAPAPVLTIADLAEVKLGPGPEQSISRVDGEPALTIAVTKMSAANTVEVSHAVQQKLDELSDQLGGAQLKVIFDQAPYVEQSVHTLTTEGLLGLVFAVLVILVFLMSVRATLVTAISIPTSVLLTFIGLNFADYTLNMLTLGALTISIGRVVDDSIVVIENIKRHLALAPDAPRAETIVEAVREVAGAITASTVTTVAVFLPMAFVGGMVGELFRPFAFTVTIALAASLLVSLTIVPVLAFWFLRGSAVKSGDAAKSAKRRKTAEVPDPAPAHGVHGTVEAAATEGSGENRGISALLSRWYRPVIEWTLLRPGITLIIAVLVLGGTVAASPLMKTNFMGSDEQNSVGLVQTLEPGTSLEAQLHQAERVEEALGEIPEVETVQVTIGSAGGGMAAIFGSGGDGTVNYSITTDPDAKQSEVQDRVREAVDALEDAGDFSLGQSDGGITSSSAIEVNVTAPDQETLAEASDAVLEELRAQDGLEQVESDLSLSRPYLRVRVDRALSAEAGLTEAAVAGQVANLMQPSQIGQVTVDADTISVYLSQGAAPTDVEGVAALSIQTANGPQRLDALATVKVADGPVTVRTEDGVRMVTVSALPKGDDLGTAGIAVNAALEKVDLPAGANASIGGVMSQQSEAFEQLGIALLAAILIVYVVMVATFRSLLQPLLLLVSVPFAATGAILLLIVTGIPLGVASLIGVLMLIGIVVTNAIVLIDLVNQYRARGDALRDAVLHGTMQRLRPIVMTALATILALTPMALGITGKGGFISQPLAVVVIGGLLSSTVLTLIVLPTLYYLVERRREGGARRRGQGGEPVSPAPSAGSPALAGAAAAVAATHAAGGATAVGAPVAGVPVAGVGPVPAAGGVPAAGVVPAAAAVGVAAPGAVAPGDDDSETDGVEPEASAASLSVADSPAADVSAAEASAAASSSYPPVAALGANASGTAAEPFGAAVGGDADSDPAALTESRPAAPREDLRRMFSEEAPPQQIDEVTREEMIRNLFRAGLDAPEVTRPRNASVADTFDPAVAFSASAVPEPSDDQASAEETASAASEADSEEEAVDLGEIDEADASNAEVAEAAEVAEIQTAAAAADASEADGPEADAPETEAAVAEAPGAKADASETGADAPDADLDVLSAAVEAEPGATEVSKTAADVEAEAEETESAEADVNATEHEVTPLVLPGPETETETATAMGPATEQMSRELASLGFVGDDNPLSDLLRDLDDQGAEEEDAVPERAPDREPVAAPADSEADARADSATAESTAGGPAPDPLPAPLPARHHGAREESGGEAGAPASSADPQTGDEERAGNTSGAATEDGEEPDDATRPIRTVEPARRRATRRDVEAEAEPERTVETGDGSEPGADPEPSTDSATPSYRAAQSEPETAGGSEEQADPEPREEPRPVAAPERDVTEPDAAERDAAPRQNSPGEQEAAPEQEIEAEPATDSATGGSAEEQRRSYAATPLPGELDWEQLIWEATHEIDGDGDDEGNRDGGESQSDDQSSGESGESGDSVDAAEGTAAEAAADEADASLSDPKHGTVETVETADIDVDTGIDGRSGPGSDDSRLEP